MSDKTPKKNVISVQNEMVLGKVLPHPARRPRITYCT
jgi:hypothetical protein